MVRTICAIFIGVLSAVLLSVTAPKLYKMSQIKGWVPGGAQRQVTVTSKRHQTAGESPDGGEAYWVAWNGGDITVRGKHRTNMFREQWSTVKIGDKIDIVSLPRSGDTYLKDGIYVSYDNFVLDLVLLTLELLGLYSFLRAAEQMIRKRKAKANA